MDAAIKSHFSTTGKSYLVLPEGEEEPRLAIAGATDRSESDFQFREITPEILDDVIRQCQERIRLTGELRGALLEKAERFCRSLSQRMDRATAALEMAQAFLRPLRSENKPLPIDTTYGGYPGPAECVIGTVKTFERAVVSALLVAERCGVEDEAIAALKADIA